MKEAIIQYNDNPDDDGNHMVISWKELVRCKDCKHWSNKTIMEYHLCTRWHKYMKNFATSGNWFCADGERKTDD